MRKVTAEEIEELYRFTRKHYVEYYDVQTELVDHLASAMEENWKDSPEILFEENLNKEFKKFGIFGFSDIVEKKAAAMGKKYTKLMLAEIVNLLKKPVGILSGVLLFWISYFLMDSELGYEILLGGIFILAVIQMIFGFKMQRKLKKKKEQHQRVYLLEEMILNFGGIVIVLILPFNLLNAFSAPELAGNEFLKYFLAFLISAVVFIGYTCFFVLPVKKDKILNQVYPQFFRKL